MSRLKLTAVLAMLAVWGACAPQPIPAAPTPGDTQSINFAMMEGILVPVAAHIRQLAEQGAGPTGIDSIAISSETLSEAEMGILQRELPGVATGNVMQFQTNCRPRAGCELTVRRWFRVGSPELQPDGTAVVRLTHSFRTPSMRRPTATFVADLVLSRSAGVWSVASVRPVMAD
jgi:hypothetical protein